MSTVVQRGDLVVSLAEQIGVRCGEKGIVTCDVFECDFGVQRVRVAWEFAGSVGAFACEDIEVIN